MKNGDGLARNARFDAAVSMGEAAKPFLFEGVKASCNVVLQGRRGTL